MSESAKNVRPAADERPQSASMQIHDEKGCAENAGEPER